MTTTQKIALVVTVLLLTIAHPFANDSYPVGAGSLKKAYAPPTVEIEDEWKDATCWKPLYDYERPKAKVGGAIGA